MSEKVNENLTPEELEQMANALMEENAPAAEKKEEKKSAPAAPPAPTKEELLLTEIRDLLKEQKK